jgi:outer membrane protein assembly factor BamB
MNRSGRPALAFLLVLAATLSTATASAAAATVRPHVTTLFDAPDALAVVGADLFVADRNAGTVTEVATAKPGTLVRTIGGFSTPDAMVAYGTDVLVASLAGNVTSFSASTGAHLWTAAKGDGLASPVAMSLVGSDLFVVDVGGGGQVTELDAANGKLIRLIHGPQYGFSHPVAIARAPAGMFVANAKGNSVTEFNQTTGAFVYDVHGLGYYFDQPSGITSDGTNVWVTNPGNNSVTEFSASTHAFIRHLVDGNYGFTNPAPIAFGDKQIYVASPPGSSPMITGAYVNNGTLNFWMCNSNDAFHFDNPQALLVSGGSTLLWVANQNGNSITEMSAATGDLVATAP